MADWDDPTVSSAYTDFLSELKARDADVASGLDPAVVTVTNPDTGFIRWNSASNKWQKYNGSTWADLTATYAIDISGSAGSVDWSDVTSTPTTLAGYGITDAQGLDADLTAVAGLSTTGLIVRTGAGTATTRTLTAPAAGITISNGDGVSGNPTLALANDLLALESLASTGIARRTATSTWSVGTTVATAEIADEAVTYAKMQHVSATDKLLGRSTSGAGAVEEITCTSFARSLLDDASADTFVQTLLGGADDDVFFETLVDGMTESTLPATGDLVALSDVSSNAGRKMTLANAFKVVNGLTEDTSPDEAADFLLTYDASASTAKKVSLRSARIPIAKSKLGNESVTSSTTLQDDDDLTFAIGANETWSVTATLAFGSSLTTTGFRVGLSVPSGASFNAHVHGVTNSSSDDGIVVVNATSNPMLTDATTVAASAIKIMITARVVCGATPGNVTVQWAQGTSSGTALVCFVGSELVAYKVV